jgi:hypothetical protein
MAKLSILDSWIYGMSLIPAHGGGGLPVQDRVDSLIDKRHAEGWQLVSDDTQGDGTRALHFRRVENVLTVGDL